MDYNHLSYILLPETATDAVDTGDHLCAVVEGQVRCWAGNSYAQSIGEVGSPPSDVYSEDPHPTTPSEKADTATASEGSSRAQGASRSVYRWRTNRRGELGVAADIGHHTPHSVVKAPLPRPAVKFFGRRIATSCVALDDSPVYCWGGIRALDGAYASDPVCLATGTNITDMSGKIALTAAGRFVHAESGLYNPATGTIPAALTALDARRCIIAASGHPHGIDCWVTATEATYCLNTDKQTVQIAQE